MAKVKTHVEESDVLIIGGGMAGTGATTGAPPRSRMARPTLRTRMATGSPTARPRGRTS